jgi:hypothetical protein
MSKEVMPELMFREHLGVSENDKTILGSGKGNIKTARVRQESNALVVVGSNTG